MTFKKLIVAASLLPATAAAHAEQTLDISDPRSSTLWILLKQNGQLEQRLKPLRFTVNWHEFSTGPLWGNIAPATVERANSRRSYDIIPVKLENLAEQQRIADIYYTAKLIPKPLKASNINLWTPKP